MLCPYYIRYITYQVFFGTEHKWNSVSIFKELLTYSFVFIILTRESPNSNTNSSTQCTWFSHFLNDARVFDSPIIPSWNDVEIYDSRIIRVWHRGRIILFLNSSPQNTHTSAYRSSGLSSKSAPSDKKPRQFVVFVGLVPTRITFAGYVIVIFGV